MSSRVQSAFLILIAAQAAHSAEEYAARFYEVFPPARWLNAQIPGIARPGFVIFNIALIAFGVMCFALWVRPRRARGSVVVWLWVVLEVYNGLAHLAWAAMIQRYSPGLVTAPLLLGIALYLALRVRAATRVP